MTRNEREKADQPLQVLVVDDDPDMLNLLEATIECGFGEQACVKSFLNPLEARARLEESVVDLLITDLEMPDISGLELLRAAKRRNAWTQVVLVTGHSAGSALSDAMDLGATDYLVKPLDPVELEQVLGETCSRLRRWRRSLAQTISRRGASAEAEANGSEAPGISHVAEPAAQPLA